MQDVPIFRAARNVDVVGKPDFVYQRGSSPMASTLHGASILLRLSGAWDWFVNLSVDDYPLVTQDGWIRIRIPPAISFEFVAVCDLLTNIFYLDCAELLHILSHLPKDLNFVNHTSYIGWRE